MKKEEWESIRDQIKFPTGVWFSFYKERGGTIDDIKEFERVFLKVMGKIVVCTDGAIREITEESALHKIKSYYDAKFLL